MAEAWEGVFEEDIAQKRPIDEQLQNTLNFVQEHETVLREIENATHGAPAEVHEFPYPVVKVSTVPIERVLAQDMVVSDNELLQKVLTVMVFLCDEMNELKDIAENKLFGPLLMFGAHSPSLSGEDTPPAPGDRERRLGQILPTLQEVANFVDRCYAVSINTVQQLASLMNSKEALYRSVFQNVPLTQVFNTLGDMLVTLYTLDQLIQTNEELLVCWSYYKSLITTVRSAPESYGTDAAGIAAFEHMIVALDHSIMNNTITKGCLEQNYELLLEEGGTEGHVSVRENSVFLSTLLAVIKAHIDAASATNTSTPELHEKRSLVGVYCLYALYRQLLPARIPPDAKLQRTLWSLQKTIPFVILYHKVVWYPPEFLNMYAPFDIKKPDPPVPATHRISAVQAADATFSARVQQLCASTRSWLVLCEGHLHGTLRYESNSVAQALDLRSSILLRGMYLASRINSAIQNTLTMHTLLQLPMGRAQLQDIALLLEALKGIEHIYLRKEFGVKEAHNSMVTQLCTACYELLWPVKTKLESQRKLDSQKIDLLATVTATLALLKGTQHFSPPRAALLSICSEIIGAAGSTLALGDKENHKYMSYVKRLLLLSRVHVEIEAACDCSFMLFHLNTLPIILQGIYAQPLGATRLPLLLTAACDGYKLCAYMNAGKGGGHEQFINAIRESLDTEVLTPLCRDIENDLRLHVHTKHLSYMTPVNPKASSNTAPPLKPYLDLPPMKLISVYYHIHTKVAHYLNTTFYNLTTVALHDWRTYSDMKSLAVQKYDLCLLDSYLPMGSLDQGLDVLQIMRNIHVFVERFTYNMNMQQFVEFKPDRASKHLNTIKIQSIAASIRQHGLGVLNTAVNFTYQFLAQKFHIFNQFLFDDYIKAHLSREARWFRKHRGDADVDNKYPYDRALAFVRDIKKLGVTDGRSFLDQFRALITEIGNALGYVRMVRSASMLYCSEAAKFLPDMDHIINFELHAGSGTPPSSATDEEPLEPPVVGANLSADTVSAAKNLDSVVNTLIANFSEGSDYFKVLVNVFQSVFLNSTEHDHLKTFLMIVPSLCISWIDASLVAKDNMFKASRANQSVREVYFTDDGFAMGIAYCLAILKQTKKYESLHWIDSMRNKYAGDAKEMEAKQQAREAKEAARKAKEKKRRSSFFGSSKKAEEDEEDDHADYEEVHSLQLTSKRLEAQRRETEQLFFSLSGAGIFFKRTDVDT